ncbi:MAG: SRPBCC domain-containing protein, partial [Owenweeksia sp.]
SDIDHRGLQIVRTFNAPIALVWEAWTKPEHIKNWWGPNGFTNVVSLLEPYTGGRYELTMQGPDGTIYPNRYTYTEVIEHKLIAYKHEHGPHFTAHIEFEDLGGQTKITWTMLFRNREEFIHTIKTFKADKGLEQNAEKLETYLKTMNK